MHVFRADPGALRERFPTRGSISLRGAHELGIDSLGDGGTAKVGFSELCELCGQASANHPELQRLRDVIGLDVLGAGQVRDRSRHFADAVVTARGETEPLHGRRE